MSMAQEYIEIRGARENNLKDVSLSLPKRKIIIFTGVSGSGKSSLVFDTIANEAQRRLYENLSFFVRNFLPRYPQPDADAIENISMAVIVDQKRLGGGSHSTVGTVTDIATLLRLLFSRVGKPYVGYANAFSFNDPQGMCLECNGLGREKGGKIVYEGDFTGLLQADTLTGTHLLRKRPLKESFRQATGALPIVHATVTNLQDVSVNIPTGVLTVITGVAGSGKSSLINEAFHSQHQEAVVIDQSSIGTSSRSNPATYTGIMDDVRKAFAAVNNVDAGLFSFNSKGACPNCQGLGVTYTDLGFLEGVKLPCEVCGGKRFKDEVLAYTWNGKSIADVLAMTVQQALAFVKIKEVQSKLQALSDVGLDYLTLGQPLSTLSGGECQRIKLASELHKQGS